MTQIIAVIMDGLIVALLAGTMFYCARLSTHIKAFRQSRAEMEKLLADLSGNIERADRAIAGLRQGAREAGRDLQERIGEARGLSEELQIISDSCNSLASRMETLAEKAGRIAAAAPPQGGGMRTERKRKYAPAPEPEKRPRLSEDLPRRSPLAGFSIRDREMEEEEDALYEEAESEQMNEEGLFSGDREDDREAEAAFASRAERELFDALRRRKTDAGGVS